MLTSDTGRRKYANRPAERRSVDEEVLLPQRCFHPERSFFWRFFLIGGFLSCFQSAKGEEITKLLRAASASQRRVAGR